MTYHFPTVRRARARTESARLTQEQSSEVLPATIQGIPIGSREEGRVATALYALGIPFQYQVQIRGGRMRGGQVVDFVVYNPFAQPVQVFGEYWHKGEIDAGERFKLTVIEQEYGRPAVVFWAADLQTQEEATAMVRERLA